MTTPAFRPTLTDLEARDVPAALLQIIQDSPYAAAAKLDFYVNNTLPTTLTNVGFRSATPFFTQDTSTNVFVSVRPSGASVSTPPIFSQSFTLADNTTNVLVAVGDPAAAVGAATRFQLLLGNGLRTTAATVGNAEFVAAHGSPDAPAIDIKVRGVGTAANDLPPNAIGTQYTSLTPKAYTLDVTQGDGVSRVSSYALDLTNAANQAITVVASGFLGTLPTGTAQANTFGLLAVRADGTTTLLPKVAESPLLTTFAAGATGSPGRVFDFAGRSLSSGGTSTGNAQERVAVADVTGDGLPDLIAAGGPGAASRVTVTSTTAAGVSTTVTITPFEATFTGGVFVAAADLDGDGKAEVIVTPDQGGGPVVAIYSGAKLTQGLTNDAAQLTRFLGIDDAAFRGGARAAVGDVNADGTPDLAVAAGFGGGPRLALYNGKTVLTPPAAGQVPPKLTADFFVFEQTLRNGVFVGVGDVNADGFGDVIVGGGPGGGPRVLALSGKNLVAPVSQTTALGNFFVGDTNNRDGVRLAVKDLDGDQNADIVVGLGSAGTAQVRGFAGKDFAASLTGTTPTAVAALELNPFTSPGVVYVG